MLLLVTILLVVVGTISLVIGFVQSELLPIYISIACSVLAAVVLLIFSRMTAKSQQVVTSGGPAPLDTARDRADTTEQVPAFAGTGLIERSSSDEGFGPEERYGAGASAGSRFGDVEDDDDLVDTPPPATVEDDFPIERYDSRRVGEILPLLAELDLDELDIVREHEEQGKSRATVLARIDQLIDQLEAEDRQEAASRFDDEPPARTSTFAPGAVEDDELELVDTADHGDDADLDLEPVVSAPPPPTQPVTVGALPEDDDFFPIEDYEDLRASEILPLLPELDDDELVMVRDRERSMAARSSILRRIDVLLDDAGSAPAPAPTFAAEPEPEPEPEPPAPAVVGDAGFTTKVPAKRAPAARRATKAAPAKKAANKKAAALPSVPVPPKKAAAKKAPVTKSRVLEKSGTITKVSARKATAARGDAPVKKSATKTTKATVAKKATAAKSSTKAAKTTRKATKG